MEYGCIGERLGHSFSAEVHRALGGYPYELKELKKEEVGAFLTARNFRGINVTIPYKETVIPYLDEIDGTAAAVGAVNTVVNRGGKLVGYNTDVSGMKLLLQKEGIDPAGKNVFILGTGGTSKTARAVAEALGARSVTAVSRTPKGAEISYPELEARAAEVQILVNTTPVGMYPDDGGLPADPARFPDLSGVLDAVYHPLRTNLVLKAKSLGIRASGGLYMLVAQAAVAASLFFGDGSFLRKTDSVYSDLCRQKENIVLIGMPGSGKTTLGRRLSELLGKPFFDVDEEIEKAVGEPAGRYLSRVGESAFRKTEAAVTETLSKTSGTVIATGGGTVLSPDNVSALKRNGKLYYLFRPLSDLHGTEGRPLTPDPPSLARTFAIRAPIYGSAADRTVTLTGDEDTSLKRLQNATAEEP